MNSKDAHRLEQEKFKDEAVMYREREAAMARLHLSVFVAALGPLGIGLLKMVNQLPVGSTLSWILLATAPVGGLLSFLNWGRIPSDYRKSKPAVQALISGIGAAVATFVMAGYFGLKK